MPTPRALTLAATAPLLAMPLLSPPAHAGDTVFSLGVQLSFELADHPGLGIGFDLRAASILSDDCCRDNPGAIGGFIGLSYFFTHGGARLMAGIDYAEDEGELGSGGQLAWFYRTHGGLGPDTHGLALGAFVRRGFVAELGANVFLSFCDLEPSLNAWLAARGSSLLFSHSGAVEGRPLHVDGQLAHVPSFTASHRAPAPDAELAAHWRRAARAERASVTTFVELARDLASLGAPDALVRAAQRAARDEHHHAALSEAIAARHGPALFTQAPALPRRRAETPPQRFARLAHEALTDGLLNESIAAQDAHIAAQSCRHDDTRDVLRTVARDERRHADLAAATLAFALDRMPELRAPIADTLAQVTAPTSTTRPASRDGVLDADSHLDMAQHTTARLVRQVHAAL